MFLPGHSWRWGTDPCRWVTVLSVLRQYHAVCPQHCGTFVSHIGRLLPMAHPLRPLSTRRCVSHLAEHREPGCLAARLWEMFHLFQSDPSVYSFFIYISNVGRLCTSFWVVDSFFWFLYCESMWIDTVGPGGHVLENNLLKNRRTCECSQCSVIRKENVTVSDTCTQTRIPQIIMMYFHNLPVLILNSSPL